MPTASSPLPFRHWSDWVAALRAEYSARPRPAPATGASDCSFWPTARVARGGYTRDNGDPTKERPTLEGMAGLWQTPAAQQFEATDLDRLLERQAAAKAKGINGNGFGMTLANEVQIWSRDHWSTPRASDGEKGGPNMTFGAGGTPLPTQAAHWPTPAARDHKGSNSTEHVTTNGTGRMHMDQPPNFVEHGFLPSLPGQAIPDGQPSSPEHRRLNPLFVEWLMGWPTGLSGFDTVATASCRSPQPSPGCDCMDCWLNTQRTMLADLLAIDPPAQMTLL